MIDCSSSFKSVGIVPVITIEDAQKAAPLAHALVAGGIHAAEITFRTPAAAAALQAMAEAEPNMFLCAGTILTKKDTCSAIQSKARAIISPGTDMEILDYCESVGIPYIPGCGTASEVQACIKKGLSFVKLFPAEVIGGISMLQALAGPFPTTTFMPTGGISIQNAPAYLSQKNVIACGGSWIVPKDALENNDFVQIEKLAAQAKALLER